MKITKDSFRARLHQVIPGGAHTYSRGDDQFPSNAPSILERGEGAYVYDPSGNKYLDYGMGLRSVNIGYGNREIADACYQEILKGNNLTRATLTELKAAELLTELIPSVDMVKFAKHGSTVTTAAVKLARAYTNRKYIAVPYEQPFFSFDDWFIGSTVLTKGTLEESSNFTLKFHYNDINSLNDLFDQYNEQIAGVILEAATTLNPCDNSCNTDMICSDCPNNKNNFLRQVQNTCKNNGSVFILDEMITGFRWHLQGAQTFYNVQPDLCTFGKAMANGQAVAALAGKSEIMKLGDILEEGKERVFLTSTTHGAEMSALGAFIKTIEILRREEVIEHFWRYGDKLVSGMNDIAHEMCIEEYFFVEGYPCSPNYVTKDGNSVASLSMRTLFAQEMVTNGVLMPYISLSLAHKETELDQTLSAVKNTLKVYKNALENGIEGYLKSPVIKPVFRKYN
jgi:glutamate-1-semialdehyde 2,1-aminomutase